ncbi:MAG: response regulator [Nitrospinae bacterium]|nr:response regulator [Nitrospinota bacterium]
MKILLVDDSKVALTMYKDGLSDELYEKKYAHNGNEALLFYKSWQPDLIVLDIQMPEMTGYTVLKKIREMEKVSGRRTAIVMATAMGDKSDIVDCAKVGIQGYIVKPFKQDELPGRLENYYNLFQKDGGKQ